MLALSDRATLLLNLKERTIGVFTGGGPVSLDARLADTASATTIAAKVLPGDDLPRVFFTFDENLWELCETIKQRIYNNRAHHCGRLYALAEPAGKAGGVLLREEEAGYGRGVFNHHLERAGRWFGLLTIVDRPGPPLFTSAHGPQLLTKQRWNSCSLRKFRQRIGFVSLKLSHLIEIVFM